MPPKPGRYSQDTKEREMEKEMTVDVPFHGYGSASFDGGYRSMPGGRSVRVNVVIGGLSVFVVECLF